MSEHAVPPAASGRRRRASASRAAAVERRRREALAVRRATTVRDSDDTARVAVHVTGPLRPLTVTGGEPMRWLSLGLTALLALAGAALAAIAMGLVPF